MYLFLLAHGDTHVGRGSVVYLAIVMKLRALKMNAETKTVIEL